jgi:hypothetical protein
MRTVPLVNGGQTVQAARASLPAIFQAATGAMAQS